MKTKFLTALLIAIVFLISYCSKEENLPWRNIGISPNELAGQSSRTWYLKHVVDNVQVFNKDSAQWYNDSSTGNKSYYVTPKTHSITFYRDGRLIVSDTIAKMLHIDTATTWEDIHTKGGYIYEIRLGSLNYINIGRYYLKVHNESESFSFNCNYETQFIKHGFDIQITQ